MLHAFPTDLPVAAPGIRSTGIAGLTRAAWRARTSATAMLARRLVDADGALPRRLLAPVGGSFNARLAALLKRWKEE